MHPQFPFVLPKINVLAPVPFRSSSVSPAPIEAEKKINSQTINEILLLSDCRAEAYKGDEPLSPLVVNEPKKQRAE